MAKMLSNSNHTSVSWGGEVFEPGDDGLFDVPEEAVGDLLSHGLEIYTKPAARVYPDRPVPQWGNDDLKAKAAELHLVDTDKLDRPALIQAVTAALKPAE